MLEDIEVASSEDEETSKGKDKEKADDLLKISELEFSFPRTIRKKIDFSKFLVVIYCYTEETNRLNCLMSMLIRIWRPCGYMERRNEEKTCDYHKSAGVFFWQRWSSAIFSVVTKIFWI